MIHSLSKYGTFKKCAAQYKFRYVDKLPTQQSATASRGTDLHATIEAYLCGQPITLSAPLDFYQSWLDDLRRIEGLRPEAKLAVTRDWKACDFDSPDAWVRSVLDLLIPPRSGKIPVYDWKSGKIYDDHEDQKELYSLLALLNLEGAYEAEAIHVYVDLGKTTATTYHRDQIPALQEKWTRRFNAVESAVDFPYNPQYACRWCSFSKSNGGPCPF